MRVEGVRKRAMEQKPGGAAPVWVTVLEQDGRVRAAGLWAVTWRPGILV